MSKNSDWDLDLRAGLAGESKVADLLSLETIEVKTDRRWKETGNIYIETECYNVTKSEVVPSGLSVTLATHWAFVLENSVLIVETSELRLAIARFGRPIKCDIEPNPSNGFLIKPLEILESIRQHQLAKDRLHEEQSSNNYS